MPNTYGLFFKNGKARIEVKKNMSDEDIINYCEDCLHKDNYEEFIVMDSKQLGQLQQAISKAKEY